MTSPNEHTPAEPVEPAEAPANPGHEDTPWERLHPLTVWAGAAATGLVLGVGAVVGTVVLLVTGASLWALVPVPATVAFVALFAWIDLLRLRATRYRVTAERMELRSGIISKSYKSIPRERVRSVDVNAQIHLRLFGLCMVTVGTGEKIGSGADQIQLMFISAGQGERLRRDLLNRGPAPAEARDEMPEGTDGTAPDEVELARLSPAWFAYAPATGATVGVGLGAIATLLGINAQTQGSVWRWTSDWLGLPSSQEMASYAASRLLLVLPLSLLGLLVSGVVVLTAVAVETWWNYRLTREADGTVRLRRGLLTSVSLSVEGRRLNGVSFYEPFVLRSVGGACVRAVATGLSGADEKKTSAKSRLSPHMPTGRARSLAAALMREEGSPLDTPLARHPRSALRRRRTRAVFVSLLCAAVAAALMWAHTLAQRAWWEIVHEVEAEIVPVPMAAQTVESAPVWVWGVLAVLFAVLAFWYAQGSYRALGHGVHPRYLVVRRGMAGRDTVALERSAVIGWRISRSPFQRRLGLADVAATTAAGEGMYAAADVGLSQGLAWADEAVPGLLAPFLVHGDGEGAEPGEARP
ncbi:PH domain-containing protein [Nocardiopsis sp. CNT312]|uniref:PH domain-containing protein n=1 Tax=Nocardiopsis sp. CNT312 TaxID=1137268 RepID=UPI0004B62B59|nr:PH domain-containing protein [Nocardiopsis sp. CNT312]